MPPTIADLVERALAAFDALAATAERGRGRGAVRDRPGIVWRAPPASGRRRARRRAGTLRSRAPPSTRLAAEAARIDDPHRAIDWLSTLPQVALGGASGSAA